MVKVGFEEALGLSEQNTQRGGQAGMAEREEHLGLVRVREGA